jgi:hypothetical protein
MLGRNPLVLATAVALAVSLPASAGAQQDLRNPDNRDSVTLPATQDLRNPDNRVLAPSSSTQDLRSPDAVDASRHVGIYAVAPAGDAGESSGLGFQWGDAGIGAAAMLGLISLIPHADRHFARTEGRRSLRGRRPRFRSGKHAPPRQCARESTKQPEGPFPPIRQVATSYACQLVRRFDSC